MLDRCRQNRELQLLGIRRRDPGISYQDAVALWVQQQYGRELPAAFLERALKAIRSYEPPEATR